MDKLHHEKVTFTGDSFPKMKQVKIPVHELDVPL